jgi:fatty-acyl-CoA synthase/long-chain acyl-CoA synthetase
MDPIETHATRKPDALALVEGERGRTWRQFRDDRDRLAAALGGLGLRRGEHGVVYCPNSLEYVVASSAARAAGLVPVPMNHRLSAEEVAYVLDDSDAALVFVADAFLPLVERVRGEARGVRHWVTLEGQHPAWATPLADLLARPPSRPPVAGDESNLGGSMIYTAGTTGKPKGALRRGIDMAAVLPRLAALDLAREHVHLAAGPLYHSAPGSFATYTLVFGGTVVVLPRFDPEAALAAIARHRCTSTFMAPTLLKRIVELPAAVRARHDVGSMQVIVVAAAPCPMTVKEAVLRQFGPVLYEFYGSTELGINTILRPEDVLRKPGSCGRAAPGLEVAILDDEGGPLPAGRPGELFVRRYAGVFDEYYKKPEATRETQRGEWLSVGDVAWMDEDGYVYICDRKRDMVISGGVNIYPAEIEEVLHRHSAVADVAVFGVPDDDWGERVHAAVELRPHAAATADEIIAFARAHLAGYKVPREVSFHQALPRDTAGKLVKRVLREPHWAGRASRV